MYSGAKPIEHTMTAANDIYMTADEFRLAASMKVAWKQYDDGDEGAKKCCQGCCCLDSVDVTTTRGTIVEPDGPPKMCISPTTVEEIKCTP